MGYKGIIFETLIPWSYDRYPNFYQLFLALLVRNLVYLDQFAINRVVINDVYFGIYIMGFEKYK
jgi:hypothetical protein